MSHQRLVYPIDGASGPYLFRRIPYSFNGTLLEPRTDCLRENLTLARGIGLYRERRLKEKGFGDLSILKAHPTWGRRAETVLASIEAGDVAKLTLSGASDIELLGFYSFSEVVVIDIETLGLAFNFPIVLVGLLSLIDGGYEIRQYLASDYHLESAMLAAALDDICRFPALVSYNGRSFDVPYTNFRCSILGLEARIDQLNVDLLRYARKHYGRQLPDCRLSTLETQLLGLQRIGDIGGAAIPDVYHSFLDSRDLDLLTPICEHNAADLIALFHLLILAIEDIHS